MNSNLSFKTPIPTSDYNVAGITNGLSISFTNTIHYQNFKNYINCGKYPIINFDNGTNIHVFIGNYVLNDSDNTINCVYYLSSDKWGNDIVAKNIPLYFVVG